ncbi:MAG: hypothetical protein HYR96_01185 [Deltaproteobacteria bacterium]|nr:hypothetical protein [Deltaproteobacteria bacterium]
MKPFFTTLLLTLLGVAFVNRWVDPSYHWNSPLPPQGWGEKSLIDTPLSFDQVRFKLNLIDLQETPDWLIVGSSRAKIYSAGMFKGARVYNASVDGNSVEDVMAIWQRLKDRGKIPKSILFEVDPWSYSQWIEGSGDRMRRRLVDRFKLAEFRSKSPILGGVLGFYSENVNYAIGELSEIVSLVTLRASVTTLRHRVRGEWTASPVVGPYPEQEETTQYDSGRVYWRFDGSEWHVERGRDLAGAVEEVKAYFRSDHWSLRNTIFHDPVTTDKFRLVLKDMVNQGSHVVILSPPYHPYSAEEVKGYPKIQKAMETSAEITHSLATTRLCPESLAGVSRKRIFPPRLLKSA